VFYASKKANTPGVALIVNGQVVPSSQYKIKYSSNKHTGFGKVKLTGTDVKYISTCSTTFMILPAKETIKGKAGTINNIKLDWSSQSHATGYQIRYSTDKKFKKNVKYITYTTPKTTSMKLSNIGNGKWSKTLTIKTSKPPIPAKQEIKDFENGKNKILIKWTKQSKKYNAGYKIQYSKDKTFKKSVTEVVMKKTTKNKLKLKKKNKMN